MYWAITTVEVGIVFCFEWDVGLVLVGGWVIEVFVLFEVREEIFERPSFVAEICPLMRMSRLKL